MRNVKSQHDIRGRYGFCCRCGLRNNLADLRGCIRQIRDRMQAGNLPEDAVKDLVSDFDSCCRDFMKALATIPMRQQRRSEVERLLFHSIEHPSQVVRTVFDIDLLKGISDVKFVNMMFERRHVFEHGGGVVTKRYLEMTGDTSMGARGP
jgi:hypothetical protein